MPLNHTPTQKGSIALMCWWIMNRQFLSDNNSVDMRLCRLCFNASRVANEELYSIEPVIAEAYDSWNYQWLQSNQVSSVASIPPMQPNRRTSNQACNLISLSQRKNRELAVSKHVSSTRTHNIFGPPADDPRGLTVVYRLE
ncbi:hypothetical protein PILCRDRAFT_4951 [Piloderma croceum F 1598]|uniref:Uncharacterized protein n=1 Tax=Piloderma croceum (strain F 1598) TaxID=765440 RepID=A0A0C3G724_PILCF|nr:hypothetical protein PILCRDRAFT_4951 [Piloderma croceum F 1598]